MFRTLFSFSFLYFTLLWKGLKQLSMGHADIKTIWTTVCCTIDLLCS